MDGEDSEPFLDNVKDPNKPYLAVDARILGDQVLAIMEKKLSHNEWDVVRWKVEGAGPDGSPLSESDIARLLGRSVGQVSKEHDRAKKKLQGDPAALALRETVAGMHEM